jgi:SSS family solute:Na+ symporter
LLSAPPSQEKIEKMTWTKAIFDSETRELNTLVWYKNYRNLAILLLLLTALMVGYFI